MPTPADSRHVERRRGAVVFADLSGFTSLVQTLGDERAHIIIGDCLELIGSIAVRHGGYVHQYEGDCVMVLFGAPTALEHADRAAVNAAIEMRRRVEEFSREHELPRPLTVHVGINSGPMVAGQLRKYSADSFGVIGDTVNVAARLKDKAPSGFIYVGPETHRETREDFEYRALDPMPLKGRAERLPVYELVSTSESAHAARSQATRRIRSALVGRAAEFDALRRVVAETGRGSGRITFLFAEAGLGKSRLVSELAASVDARHVRWLEGRSLSIGQQLSFHPIADLLRNWIGVTEGEGDASAKEKVALRCTELLGSAAGEATPYLTKLMGISLEPEAERRLAATGAEALEARVQRSVLQLLEALSRQSPLFLVFEDVHWADGSSVKLLEKVIGLSAAHPVSFLFVARPGYAQTSGRICELAGAEYPALCTEIELEPLDRGAQRELVTNLLRSGNLPRVLQEEIEDRAAGNPFFAEEIVRSLLDRGLIEMSEDGIRVLARIDAENLPGTIHGVVMSRIDRLPEAQRRLLQTASVIGRNFHHAVLEEIQEHAEQLNAILEGLEEGQFLEPGGALGARGFQFKHPLIQQVTYDSMLESERAALHQEVAEAILQRLPSHVPGYDGMLAYHFGLAGDLERAEEHLDRAGEAASRLAASDEAVHFFSEAARLFAERRGERADPHRLAALERKIAVAHMNRGELALAVAHYDRALELLGERRAQTTARQALRLAWTAGLLASELYAPRLRPHRPKATPQQRDVIEIRYARAQAQTTTHPAQFVWDALDSLARLAQVDPQSVDRSGAMYASAVGIFSFGGVSFHVSRRLLVLGERAVRKEDPADLLTFRLMSFLHHYLEGDWSEGHVADPQLLDENLVLGRLWDVTTYSNIEAAYRVFRGEFAAAGEHLERLAKIRERYGYDLAASAHAGVSAYLALERRDLPEALRAAESYLSENIEALFNIIAHGTLAKTHVLLGDLEAAEAVLANGRELVSRTAGIRPYHRNHQVCAELLAHVARLERLHRQGDRKGERSLGRQTPSKVAAALRVTKKFAARRPETYRSIGTACWLAGRRRPALRWWLRARDEATRLGTRPELGRIQLEAARWLREAPDTTLGGADAKALFDAAAKIFAELGLAWDLEQLERARREEADG